MIMWNKISTANLLVPTVTCVVISGLAIAGLILATSVIVKVYCVVQLLWCIRAMTVIVKSANFINDLAL